MSKEIITANLILNVIGYVLLVWIIVRQNRIIKTRTCPRPTCVFPGQVEETLSKILDTLDRVEGTLNGKPTDDRRVP